MLLRHASVAVAGLTLVAGVLPAVVPVAAAAATECSGGRLASDPAGDHSYLQQDIDGTPADDATDLRFVDLAADAAAGTVTVTFGVTDLTDDDPEGGIGLILSADLTSRGQTTVVNVERRANPAGLILDTATIGGSSDGVTAVFDAEADTVTVTGPAAHLGEAFGGTTGVSLAEAESRVSGGIILAPRMDQAFGDCTMTVDFGLAPPTTPEPPDPGTFIGDFDPSSVTVTIIDTGVNAAHPEFDWDPSVDGPNGQLVAWWDFSGVGDPEPGTRTWYGERAPYDPDGHGSGTSAMAVGRNVSPAKTPSACPGCRLAVAKVLNEETGSLDGDIADAIRWATDVVGTDVISISIGALVPVPEILTDVHEAAGYARQRGVLVLFANGNGTGNAGLPGSSGAISPYGNSTNVLAVGAAGLDGWTTHMEPEVTAVFTVSTAAGTGSGYQTISGTSFSTPFVAGVAARVIAEIKATEAAAAACGPPAAHPGRGQARGREREDRPARGGGRDTAPGRSDRSGRRADCPRGETYDRSPDSIETLIKHVAIDDPLKPPSFEGYGEVTLAESLPTALEVVRGQRELPEVDPLTELWVEQVAGTQRDLWTNTLDPGLGYAATGINLTPGGVIGFSSPSGAFDAEVHRITLAPGEERTVAVAPAGGVTHPLNDIDMLAVPTGATWGHAAAVATSGKAGSDESITLVNTGPEPVSYDVVIYGWLIVTDQPVVVTGTGGDGPVHDGILVGDNLAGVT